MGRKHLTDHGANNAAGLRNQGETFAGYVHNKVSQGKLEEAREVARARVEQMRDFAGKKRRHIENDENYYVGVLTRHKARADQIKAIHDAAAKARAEIDQALKDAIQKVRAELPR
jgi:hypothetical protein